MKIKSIQISNILSFKYYDNIEEATKIEFNEDISIIIGENGAGKSTALEVLNFVFKKVLFKEYILRDDLYSRRKEIPAHDKKSTLAPRNSTTYEGFRLEPNWETEDKPQKIKAIVELDDIDRENINHLLEHRDNIGLIAEDYANTAIGIDSNYSNQYVIDVSLVNRNKSFSADCDKNDFGFLYLSNYFYYKNLIDIYNLENPDKQIKSLHESFILISSYRNYNSFVPSVRLNDQSASQQIQDLISSGYTKSTNQSDQNEPSIFNFVRLRVAEKHYAIFDTTDKESAEKRANDQSFLKRINEKLRLVNLEAKISLVDKQKWAYSFQFFDIKRKKPLDDINTLSAGQKAIVHLVFEAYGRGDVKGGLVIIDEPEIHLHHQFQNEYLHVIKEINEDQSCQYVLVTHSESLINSETISKVKRFALDRYNYTIVKSPNIDVDQKVLVKILDNTRSIYAFFSKKILLVEGDTDRYFFRAVLQNLYPKSNHEIAVLFVGGKGSLDSWRNFFEPFGLSVYSVIDFDNIEKYLNINYQSIAESIKQNKLDNLTADQQGRLKQAYERLTEHADFLTKPDKSLWDNLTQCFRSMFGSITYADRLNKVKENYPDIESDIEALYTNNIFILKRGALENYTNTNHRNLNEIVEFCETRLPGWINEQSEEVNEIKEIMHLIMGAQ